MAASIPRVTDVGAAAAVGTEQRWRTRFLVAWSITLAIKIVLAIYLAPFGDEAWYWQESRALDWSFSDLPPATAAMIRIGEALFGHSTFGIRAPFLLLGALLPFVLVRTGTRLFGAPAGWQAGLIALALPLLGSLGLFALPDMPLTFCCAVAFDLLERATRTRNRNAWFLLGLALAAAWLSHYRAGMFMLTGLVFLLATARGRALWREPGLWIALAISAMGLLPLLVFNATHGWVALGFQLVDRNPWSFHADGLLQPIEQALICTPPFYALLLVVALYCARRAGEAPWDLLSVCSLVPILGYLILGCFADDTRLRVHWPLPGYLPLLLVVPVYLDSARTFDTSTARWWARAATFGLLVAGMLVTYGYFALAAVPGGAGVLARFKAFPEHWVGWHEIAAETKAHLEQPEFTLSALVADNFLLAAELQFALDHAQGVYTLDHPTNTKHGRAAQLALWQRDEAGLRSLAPQSILLVVEPTARRERERAKWLSTVCSKFNQLRPAGRLELYGGRKRYLFFAATLAGGGTARVPEADAQCLATMLDKD